MPNFGFEIRQNRCFRNCFWKYYNNTQVYGMYCCFSDSALSIALLGLFCEMLYRFPNMAVANLSRDSVRAALIRGITAEQVNL